MLRKLISKAFKRSYEKAFSADNGFLRDTIPKQTLAKDIDKNLKQLKTVFENCSDVVFREITIMSEDTTKAFIVLVEGLCDKRTINEGVLKNILLESDKDMPSLTRENVFETIYESVITTAQAQKTSDLSTLMDLILSGNLALILDGHKEAIVISVQGAESRAIQEPILEPVVRGPRDGFVESLGVNISLIRRRLKTNQLKVENLTVGSLSKTNLAVCYIKGIAKDKEVDEVKTRIQRINIDGILASGYIEEFISDEKFILFPLVQHTERPDIACGSMLEGKIVILVDNTPMTLIAPVSFNCLFQSAEDYFMSPLFASLIRMLRFVGLNIALLLPAVTVAAFSYHQELIPPGLLFTSANARIDLPFPIFVEVLFMELTFELLREAGVRLPRTIGQAISTVGGLVIGQAAIQAGIVAPVPVIVVSLTAIASFTMPNYAAGATIRILRFILILLAGILGIVGIMFGLMILQVYVCSLRSFGVPYMSPFAPLSLRSLKDTFIRLPWWSLTTRAKLYGNEPIRQPFGQGPKKPDNSQKGGDKS